MIYRLLLYVREHLFTQVRGTFLFADSLEDNGYMDMCSGTERDKTYQEKVYFLFYAYNFNQS